MGALRIAARLKERGERVQFLRLTVQTMEFFDLDGRLRTACVAAEATLLLASRGAPAGRKNRMLHRVFIADVQPRPDFYWNLRIAFGQKLWHCVFRRRRQSASGPTKHV